MHRLRFRLATAAMIFALLVLNSATIASPQLISHQGYLTSAIGVPLTGSHSLTFGIYDVVSGGSPLWTETHGSVEVNQGLYSVLLGSVTPLSASVFSGANRYLGITVDSDPQLSPRRQIAASAYALRSDVANNSDSLGGHQASYFLNWSNLTGIPAGFADGVDNVGSGDITGITAGEGLMGGGSSGEIQLDLDTAGVASKHILNGTILNEDISASAAIAINKISGTAVNLSGAQIISGTKTFGGTANFGDSSMTVDDNGVVIGSSFWDPSQSYVLMVNRDVNTSSSRYGVHSDIDNYGAGTVYGLYGRASAATAGAASSGEVRGIYGLGISDGDNRYGAYLFGRARTVGFESGNTYGAYCRAQYGSFAYGVHALTESSSYAYGLYAEVTNNGSADGCYTYVHDNGSLGASIGTNNFVLTNGNNGYAVAGTAGSNTGVGYAIYGHAYSNSTDWAGYFNGNVNVVGTIFMPSKITKIDHPLDPENQNLLLAGIDSPEMLVKQSGTVVTNANGEAVVKLPGYLSAIASNFRYQLTVVGEFAQAIVGQKLQNDQFQIRTDKPNIEVCWEITGERIDNFAKANPVTNEQMKPAEQRGKYLHPAAYGLQKERGVDYSSYLELTKKMELAKKSKPVDDEELVGE